MVRKILVLALAALALAGCDGTPSQKAEAQRGKSPTLLIGSGGATATRSAAGRTETVSTSKPGAVAKVGTLIWRVEFPGCGTVKFIQPGLGSKVVQAFPDTPAAANGKSCPISNWDGEWLFNFTQN